MKKIQRFGTRSDFLFKKNKQHLSSQYPENEQEFLEWQEGLHKELSSFWKELMET